MLGKIENGVRVINVIELLSSIHGENNLMTLSNDIIQKDVCQFIADNDAYYYCESKERFSNLTAIRKSKELGKKVVLLEVF